MQGITDAQMCTLNQILILILYAVTTNPQAFLKALEMSAAVMQGDHSSDLCSLGLPNSTIFKSHLAVMIQTHMAEF